MEDLPEEILLKIFSYLSPYYEYHQASAVCRKWHRIIHTLQKLKQRTFHQAIVNAELSYKMINPDGATRTERPSYGRRGRRRSSNQNKLEPAPRFSHSACVLGNKMFVFGGCSLKNSAFNDLNELDLLTKKWSRTVINQGFMPAPRECATLVPYEDKLVLFGGWCSPRSTGMTANAKFFNDTSIIDAEHETCVPIISPSKETPGPRAGHNACISGSRMIVFGGAQRILRYDDVWYLDMESLEWRCPSITDKKPNGRFGHSQFAMGEEHVLVIGGCGGSDGSNSLCDDAWLLNTINWTWREIRVKNELWKPFHLWCHPAARVGDKIVTFSDQNVCNACLGVKMNPSENTLFNGPAPVSFTCIKCRKNKVKASHYDSHFQLSTLDCSGLLSTGVVSWKKTISHIPHHLSRSRSLFTIVAGKAEILIFGGIYNRERMNALTPTNVIKVSAKHE